jgi:hypothetical protein
LSVFEQLEQVTEALQRDPGIHLLDLSPPMRQVLGIRNAA